MIVILEWMTPQYILINDPTWITFWPWKLSQWKKESTSLVSLPDGGYSRLWLNFIYLLFILCIIFILFVQTQVVLPLHSCLQLFPLCMICFLLFKTQSVRYCGDPLRHWSFEKACTRSHHWSLEICSRICKENFPFNFNTVLCMKISYMFFIQCVPIWYL